MHTFESIKRQVESSYPVPVASVFRKCRIAGREDLGGRHKNLVDLFEVFIKYICIVQLQETRKAFPDFISRLPQQEKSLEFLKKKQGTGDWVGLMRTLSNPRIIPARDGWLHEISNWYNQPKSQETAATFDILKEIGGINFTTRTRTPVAEICNALVNYRNKQLAHAANKSSEELGRRLPLLEGVLAYLIHSAGFLQEMMVMFTDRIEKMENDQWRVHGIRLSGINDEPISMVSGSDLELSKLYLAENYNGEPIDEPTLLAPFMIWKQTDEMRSPEVFFFTDVRRTSLEYQSYKSGTYYHYKGQKSGLEDFVSIEIKEGREPEVYESLSPEERAQRAEDYYKQAILLNHQERYEDAIELLELSLEYNRSAATFLELGRTKIKLDDDPESILRILQHCLELDAENQEVHQLIEQVESDIQNQEEDREEVLLEAVDKEDADQGVREIPTIWHALTPRRWRSHVFIWSLFLFMAWYVPSAFVEYMWGSLDKVIINVLQFLLCCMGFSSMLMGRQMIERMKVSLSLQLDTMRFDRFEIWFQRELRAIFGDMVSYNGKVDLVDVVRRNKNYYVICAAWVVVIGVSGYIMCELHKQPVGFMVKRWFDNIIMIGFGGSAIVRYIVMSTVFINRFSRLSLKPMLTKINDVGLRSFAPLAILNVLSASIIWILVILLCSYEIVIQYKIDFFFLVVGTAVVMMWSVGLPYTMYRAARGSKSKAIHVYSGHIEKAFKAFLDHPDDDTAERFRWLVKHQAVIQRISTWPLTWAQTIFVIVGSNLFILVVSIWYAATRMGRWDEIVIWLKGLL